jgi:hypothetical protein
MPALQAQTEQAAMLAASPEESNEGYYQLSWQSDGPVRLVESPDPDFATARTLYVGADTASFVSGRPDGRWYYRLEAANEPRVISETVAVTVRHHSLGRALGFFALGAVVFLATLGLIVFGSRGRDERA